MSVFYNDNDAFASLWLKELIKAGELPEGKIDDRSILEVEPDDLRPFRQCHFFAGIGGWPYALELAGFPSDREIWTASLPCQPLSVAGQRKGDADDRHLWPAFYRLIAECKPPIIVGEQVASRDGREWLAGVRADLEVIGYACGAANLPACSIGAPHRRERLYWCACLGDSSDGQQQERQGYEAPRLGRSVLTAGTGTTGESDGAMADSECVDGRRGWFQGQQDFSEDGERSGVANTSEAGCSEYPQCDGYAQQSDERASYGRDVARRGDGGMGDADGRDANAERLQRGGWDRLQPQGGCDHWLAKGGQWAEGGMAYARQLSERRPAGCGEAQGGRASGDVAGPSAGLLGGAEGARLQGQWSECSETAGRMARRQPRLSSQTFWNDSEWRIGADGKARRVGRAQSLFRGVASGLPDSVDACWVESTEGTIPLLAQGFTNRVGLLRGYGNSIVPQLAAQFVASLMECAL